MNNELSQSKSKFQLIWKNILPHAPGGQYEVTETFSQALDIPLVPESWRDCEYRQAAMEAEIEQGIAWQVRINREERGWKQADLAAAMKTGQSAISKLESADGGDVQLSTLVKAAHAFDCALLVRFMSYRDFAVFTKDVRPERLLACGFDDEFNQPKLVATHAIKKASQIKR